jgi:hypothetical protein
MSPSQLRIESPDFNRIISGDKRATHDAIKTLWLATNEVFSRLDRSRQYWTDVPWQFYSLFGDMDRGLQRYEPLSLPRRRSDDDGGICP